ncbi:MAG: hypothetical protein HY694_04830 [Deltaproteobacteria bacterium]|nr:hypothetical protein [Deltaproteobacteria bacterium]
MKCGICGKKMKLVKEEALGEKVEVLQCQCGEELVELDGVIRIQKKKKLSLLKFKPTKWGKGSEKTSEEVDELLYGQGSKRAEFEFAFPRKVNLSKAKKEVLELVREQPNLYADEIAARLNLDIETVISAIGELMKEKKVIA